MKNEEWRELIGSEQYQVYQTQDYLGQVTTAKIIGGQLLWPEHGGHLRSGEVDSYCLPYIGVQMRFINEFFVTDLFEDSLSAYFAERKRDCGSYALFCNPNITFKGEYISEIVIDVDIFRENALLYCDDKNVRDYVYFALNRKYEGVSIVGENGFVNVPIKKFNVSNGKQRKAIEFYKK